MADCNETLRELYLFLDGQLTDEDREHIQHHLDDCSPCLEAYDFEAELRLVIRSRCVDQVPDSLRARIAEALQCEPNVDAEAGAAAEVDAGPEA